MSEEKFDTIGGSKFDRTTCQLKAWVDPQDFRGLVNLSIFGRPGPDRYAVLAGELVFKSYGPDDVEHGAWRGPDARMRPEAAQQLMDDLWNCGLRPSAGRGSAGQLEAVQGHLQDLQTANAKLLDAVICKLTGKAKA